MDDKQWRATANDSGAGGVKSKMSASSQKFITRVDINSDADPDCNESFNFMHDPSTLIQNTPHTYCNNVADDRPTVGWSHQPYFADISITTTKPSLPESHNLKMTVGQKDNTTSSFDSGMGRGDGLLIMSERSDDSSQSTKMKLLNVKGSSQSFLRDQCSENTSPQGSGSFADSGAQSPELTHQFRRKVSLMPLVTEEELKNHPMGHKDPVSVAQVFGEDFASKFCVLPLNFGPSSVSAFSLFPPKDEQAATAGGHSPLPYDSKEKMLLKRVSPETTLLPFEIRDKNLPAGVPTVKVRRKPLKLSLQHDISISASQSPILSPQPIDTSITSSNDDTYEVAVALSPITPKFPSLPATATNFSFSDKWENATDIFTFDTKSTDEIGASNPDIVQFQQEINAWLQRQSSIIGSAFVLTSSDINLSYCEVCGTEYLEDPINCGDSEYLRTLFNFPVINQHRGQATSEEMIRVQHRRQQIIDNPELLQEENMEPTILDLKKIREEKPNLPIDGFHSIIRNICTTTYANCTNHIHAPRTPSPEGTNAIHSEEQQSRVHKYESGGGQKSRPATGGSPTQSREKESVEKFEDSPTNSIIGIQAKCGFVAGLVLAHRSEKQKKKDLETILPHISLMATLMSIIDNVEEQKRLARQTKRFLTMTQNVFSSLRKLFNIKHDSVY